MLRIPTKIDRSYITMFLNCDETLENCDLNITYIGLAGIFL